MKKSRGDEKTVKMPRTDRTMRTMFRRFAKYESALRDLRRQERLVKKLEAELDEARRRHDEAFKAEAPKWLVRAVKKGP